MTSNDPIAEARRQWQAHGWGEAATGMAAVTSVVRLNQLFQARAEAALKPFGITFSRFEVLRLLLFSRSRALPMSVVSSRLQVHPASATSSVDRLVKDGLVRREPNPDDGRGVLVSVTDQGIALMSGATAALNEMFVDLALDPDDQEALVAIAARYRQAVENG